MPRLRHSNLLSLLHPEAQGSRRLPGQRNPRAFVPATKIRTEAGIDHDYNFLSGIERAKQQLEREVVENRG